MTGLRSNGDTGMMRNVGRVLRELREEANLTRAELAAAVGVDPTTITHWMRGETPVTLVRFLEFCQATGADPRKVMDRIIHLEEQRKRRRK